MKLLELKNLLKEISEIKFRLDNDGSMAEYLHITEVGQLHKRFIDCGGTVRYEDKLNIQLWDGDDKDHKLTTEKFTQIITMAQDTLKITNQDIEVQYQYHNTIGTFDLNFDGEYFVLTTQATNCLAPNVCCQPANTTQESCCS